MSYLWQQKIGAKPLICWSLRLECTRDYWNSFSRKPGEALARIAMRTTVTCKQIRNYKT
ncbi:hypothetical protein NC653_003990 [Populus alba x Populus x berolinensis]|uniref:Uncharacterized protein n=1 Tax=Populus alba x Populus x berolinensis TaxID=444605 RepID=A0AAD6WIZ6_9ROSI|nr:hypothetical protein NC653_003990 [Populus alba x Populus x berolinensis]